MSKTLRTVAVIAGAIALVATGVGAIGGAAFASTAVGSAVGTIATYASVAATPLSAAGHLVVSAGRSP